MDDKVYDTKKRIMQLQYLLNHKNMHFARKIVRHNSTRKLERLGHSFLFKNLNEKECPNCSKIFSPTLENLINTIYNIRTFKLKNIKNWKERIVMNIKITSKELEATEAIKDYIEKKAERLVKYFGEEFDVYATIRTEGNDKVAEMNIKADTEDFRAVTANKDLYASIDKDIDILEGQVRKMKTKKDKQNMTESIRVKNEMMQNETEVTDEIIKVLYYDIKPMTPEDAKLKLQEQPQNRFLAFIDVDTGKTNVIYRLKDNKNFGLVEPEA